MTSECILLDASHSIPHLSSTSTVDLIFLLPLPSQTSLDMDILNSILLPLELTLSNSKLDGKQLMLRTILFTYMLPKESLSLMRTNKPAIPLMEARLSSIPSPITTQPLSLLTLIPIPTQTPILLIPPLLLLLLLTPQRTQSLQLSIPPTQSLTTSWL